MLALFVIVHPMVVNVLLAVHTVHVVNVLLKLIVHGVQERIRVLTLGPMEANFLDVITVYPVMDVLDVVGLEIHTHVFLEILVLLEPQVVVTTPLAVSVELRQIAFGVHLQGNVLMLGQMVEVFPGATLQTPVKDVNDVLGIIRVHRTHVFLEIHVLLEPQIVVITPLVVLVAVRPIVLGVHLQGSALMFGQMVEVLPYVAFRRTSVRDVRGVPGPMLVLNTHVVNIQCVPVMELIVQTL